MEQTGLIAARALVYAALLGAAGIPLYLATQAPRARLARGLGLTTAAFALVAALASLWWLAEAVAAMAALPLAELDTQMVRDVAAATPLGAVLHWRMIALAALVAAALLRLPAIAAALAGLAAMAGLAFTGHAGATVDTAGTWHRIADAAHLAAAACWIGALIVFLANALRRKDNDRDLVVPLSRFANTGSLIVAVLFVTGTINTVLTAGWPLPLSSQWMLLLALKLGLLAAMLALAAANRWRLTPALDRGEPGAKAALRRSLALELSCGIAILAVVAVLGTLDPAA